MMQPTESELCVFVGQRADYYLKTWFPEDRLSQPISGEFNPAAFWFSGVWFAYRKMYGKATIFVAAFLLAQLSIVMLLLLITLAAPGSIASVYLFWAAVVGIPSVVLLALAFCCGTYGNLWYQDFSCKAIAQLQQQSAISSAKSLPTLSVQGGTSWLGALGFMLLLVSAQSLFIVVVLQVFNTVARSVSLL